MSSVSERVTGKQVSVWLAHEVEVLRRDLERAVDRVARTLVKNAGMSVVLVGVRPGGVINEHVAAGPVTIHVVEGCIELDVDGRASTLGSGMLMSIDGGTRHSVSSSEGGIFVLTVVSDRTDARAERQRMLAMLA